MKDLVSECLSDPVEMSKVRVVITYKCLFSS